MFHVRRRPADSQPRRRKKKPLGISNGGNNMSIDREGPVLVEITHSGDGGRRIKLSSEPIEVGYLHRKSKRNKQALFIIFPLFFCSFFRLVQQIQMPCNYLDHQFSPDIV